MFHRIQGCKFFIVLLFAAMVSGCSTSSHIQMERAVLSDQAGSSIQGRLISQSGTMEIEVDEIASLEEKVRNIIKPLGGHITSINIDADNNFSANIEVPQAEFITLMNRTSILGIEVSRSSNSRDITNGVVDREAELKNLIALRDRMHALLIKANTVDEILQVERELSRIQTHIDSLNRVLNNMHNRVDNASVYLTASEAVIYGPLGYIGNGILWGIKKLFVIN